MQMNLFDLLNVSKIMGSPKIFGGLAADPPSLPAVRDCRSGTPLQKTGTLNVTAVPVRDCIRIASEKTDSSVYGAPLRKLLLRSGKGSSVRDAKEG